MGVALGETCTAIGFLTVVEHPQHGLFGGYLVLNTAGRPIEFHCTAPLKPNRAQEILYGPTLKPYLYGEQIGRALVSKSTTATIAICTDCEPVLELGDYVPMPVVLVLGDRVEPNADSSSPGNAATPPAPSGRQRLTVPRQPGLRTLKIGGNRLAVRYSRVTDAETVATQLAAVVDGFDLTEPFGRIRDAIEEAQRAAR
ncbi:MAG: hypothetical protein K2Y37_24700 [Pirellulales bacterium]|nr:hypothetical protein [Pirellulales bacterium]